MPDNISDTLKSILNNPEIMDMLAGLKDSKITESDLGNDSSSINSELKSVMSRIGNNNDRRINLLNALKPYMKSNRAERIDKAVKIIKLTQLGSILKDL